VILHASSNPLEIFIPVFFNSSSTLTATSSFLKPSNGDPKKTLSNSSKMSRHRSRIFCATAAAPVEYRYPSEFSNVDRKLLKVEVRREVSVASLLTSVISGTILSARAKSFLEMGSPDCMVSDMLFEMFMFVVLMKDSPNCGEY